MSEIRQGVRDYLTLRRSLGFKLIHHEKLLNDFVSFFEERGSPHIAAREAMKWARKPERAQPPCWARRLGMVRGFARFWIASDPRTEIPPLGLLPSHYKRKAPHIYTDRQICQLIKAAKRLPSKLGLRACTYSNIFGLIAVGGGDRLVFRVWGGIHAALRLRRSSATRTRALYDRARIAQA